MGGYHIAVTCSLDAKPYRILAVIDDEEVYVTDMDRQLTIKPYNDILTSRKTFDYMDDPELHHYYLPALDLPEDKKTFKIGYKRKEG